MFSLLAEVLVVLSQLLNSFERGIVFESSNHSQHTVQVVRSSPHVSMLSSLALSLGHHFSLLRSPLGGFLRIGSQVTRHCAKLPGMVERLEKLNLDPMYTMMTYTGEKLLGPVPLEDGRGVESGLFTSRFGLQQLLYDYVVSLGVEVHFDKRVEFVYENPETKKGGCVTRTGEKFEADLLVAADGIGSKSSNLVLGSRQRTFATSSGYAMYHATYPTGKFPPQPSQNSNLLTS